MSRVTDYLYYDGAVKYIMKFDFELIDNRPLCHKLFHGMQME